MRTLRVLCLAGFSLIGGGYDFEGLGAAAADEPATAADLSKETLIYIGSRAQGPGSGIHLFRLQSQGSEVFQNVTLVPLGLAVETPRPVYFEIDSGRRLLFAVNEVDEFGGQPGGSVSAFSIDSGTGKLTLLSQRSSKGRGPCHIALDKEGRNAMVANCDGGSVAVLPVGEDGQLGEATEVIEYAAEDGSRSGGKPLAAGVTFDPAGKFAFVCSPAADRVMAYRFDAAKGKLTPLEPAFTAFAEGAGPRRMVFRPDGKFAYVLNELNSTVSALAYDGESGGLKELQNLSTLPGYFDGPNRAAELAMHPSGKYLFSANDGHNSLILYTIDPAEGTLNWVEEQGTGGKSPRDFGIEPAGKHLAIANGGSDTLLGSRIDAGNGRLKPSGIFAKAVAPACVRFLGPAGMGK